MLMPYSKKQNPLFTTYCQVSSDAIVLDMMRMYGRDALRGLQISVYKPRSHGFLPSVDLLFTWRGLEQYTLDDIHQIFKETANNGIKYALIGNSPGHANAELLETRPGVFSVQRSQIPALNVRAYPFGFSKALRVLPFLGKQLLLYNTSQMREKW